MDTKESTAILSEIQAELKAPKNQKNEFGGFMFRSCEDIVEAAKPLLAKRALALNLTDEVVFIGTRHYVKATASIVGLDVSPAVAYAREPEARKGMDDSQITGTASSYARKYALNGLFAIDDTKDPDIAHGKVERITDEQLANIECLITEIGADREAFTKWAKTALKVERLEDLNPAGYKHALEALEAKRKSMAK